MRIPVWEMRSPAKGVDVAALVKDGNLIAAAEEERTPAVQRIGRDFLRRRSLIACYLFPQRCIKICAPWAIQCVRGCRLWFYR